MLESGPSQQEDRTGAPSTRIPAHKRSRQLAPDGPSEDETAPDGAVGDEGDTQATALTKRYGTRSSNQSRHPGLDIGPKWQEVKRERDAATAKRAQKKVAKEAKNLEKSQQAHAYEEGIAKLAELDDRADEDEREEEEYIAASTACGYRKASLTRDGEVRVGVDADEEESEPDDARQRRHGRRSALSDVYFPSDSSSPSEPNLPGPLPESDEDVQRPAKKVRYLDCVSRVLT